MKELICESCRKSTLTIGPDGSYLKCSIGRILPTKKNICNLYRKKHGGPRPGSGRPKLAGKKVIQSFALTPGTVDFINKYSKANNLSKSEAVEIIIKSCL